MPQIVRVCQNPACQQEFKVYPYRAETAIYCSRSCKHICRIGRDREIKFWNRVQKTDTCWIWKGGIAKDGYGVCWIGTKTRAAASRVSYELTYGKIPDRIFVCHHCDNPPCVRPDHLFLGTARDNIQDAKQKGHLLVHPKGEKHFKAILKESDVVYIYSQKGKISGGKIAIQFGVARTTIFAIWNGKSWKHLNLWLAT